MATVFFIGDTHFGHDKLVTGEIGLRKQFKSVEEHDEALIKAWNDTVRSKDVVYHLGDVSFGNFEAVARLKGDKKLVMGNHDKFSRLSQYFTNFYGALIYHGYILTHVPVHPDQLEFRFGYNIHGHLHNKTIADKRYINVCCEQIGYRPIALEEIQEKIDGDSLTK